MRHDSIRHFFADLRKATKVKQLEKKYPGYKVGIRFFNNRTVLYEWSQIHMLLNTVNTYDTVVAAHGRKQTAEVIRNIELIKVPLPQEPEWYAGKRARTKLVLPTKKRKTKRKPRARQTDSHTGY